MYIKLNPLLGLLNITMFLQLLQSYFVIHK